MIHEAAKTVSEQIATVDDLIKRGGDLLVGQKYIRTCIGGCPAQHTGSWKMPRRGSIGRVDVPIEGSGYVLGDRS